MTSTELVKHKKKAPVPRVPTSADGVVVEAGVDRPSTSRKRVLTPRISPSVAADAKADRILHVIPGRAEKELKVERVSNSGLWQIRWTGGGGVPSPLRGFYTSSETANKAIAVWLGSKQRP